MNKKFLKKTFLLAGIFLLSMTMLGNLAFANGNHNNKSSKKLKITEVYVDFANSEISIHGSNFAHKRKTPRVFLAGEELEVSSADDQLIVAELPKDPDGDYLLGDYLLNVSIGKAKKYYDYYDLTIGAVGPQGLAGADGAAGADGTDGTDGAVGPEGPPGPRGTAGPAGADGTDGAAGPEGPPGPQGEKGDQGDQGIQGEVGSQGIQGEVGSQGIQGEVGSQGIQGEVGPQGIQGPAGTDGACPTLTQGEIQVVIDDLIARIEFLEDNVYPRFSDMGDGTIRDNKTGLIWLKDANCFGTLGWGDADSEASSLEDGGDCDLSDGSSAGDWRLPTYEEWMAFMSTVYSTPALVDTVGDAQWSGGNAFIGVQPNNYYWSTGIDSIFANVAYVNDGSMRFKRKTISTSTFVWPVRTVRDDN